MAYSRLVWTALNVAQHKLIHFAKTWGLFWRLFFFNLISYCCCISFVAQDSSSSVAQGNQNVGHPCPSWLTQETFNHQPHMYNIGDSAGITNSNANRGQADRQCIWTDWVDWGTLENKLCLSLSLLEHESRVSLIFPFSREARYVVFKLSTFTWWL